ncbi:hypothetical protein V9W64_10535 [Neisseria leonii]|uniref:Uncharacterized protein n=1 Tax=Neisseria leonii TaxID=2995413 RepID=A0A9X4IBB4_9NEIS|nr:hypothetical protein [Neisseria sp. 51.81]MDD9328240.1 hypothetical protein [Neisseria sp. 51.81]
MTNTVSPVSLITSAFRLTGSLTAVKDGNGDIAVFSEKARALLLQGNTIKINLEAHHNSLNAALGFVLPPGTAVDTRLMRMRLKRGKDYRVGGFTVQPDR